MISRALPILLSFAAACATSGSQAPKDNFDADAKSGPDAKRSGAQHLEPNKPHTDEVSYSNQDKTDWYQVDLKGKPGVLSTLIHWDNDQADVRIDVFDEFGQQIAASPVRDKGAKQKKLLTQIDRVGTYFIRVSAPTKADSTVYTMQANWDQPAAQAVVVAPPTPQRPDEPPMPLSDDKPSKPRHAREPKEPKEKPAGETVQARILTSYREGSNLIIYIDKGSAAGVKVGSTGAVLEGPSGEDALSGGELRVTRVIDANKCQATTTLHSLGSKNTRVTLNVSK
jgi:hypothetical protein